MDIICPIRFYPTIAHNYDYERWKALYQQKSDFRQILRAQHETWLKTKFHPCTEFSVLLEVLKKLDLAGKRSYRIRQKLPKKSLSVSDVKSTLQRADSLSSNLDQYKMVIISFKTTIPVYSSMGEGGCVDLRKNSESI